MPTKFTALRVLFILLAVFITVLSHAQFNLRRIPVSDLPKEIQGIENVSMALRWKDTLGDQLVILTKRTVQTHVEKRVIYSGPKGTIYYRKSSRDKELPGGSVSKQNTPSFASNFKIINDSAVLKWTAMGVSIRCDDEDVNHVKNWCIVTDLDKDAIAEVWFISKGECVDDADGGKMKIVMCEDDYRYTMSGSIATQSSLTGNLDAAFRNGPELFRKYALQLWDQFLNKE